MSTTLGLSFGSSFQHYFLLEQKLHFFFVIKHEKTYDNMVSMCKCKHFFSRALAGFETAVPVQVLKHYHKQNCEHSRFLGLLAIFKVKNQPTKQNYTYNLDMGTK